MAKFKEGHKKVGGRKKGTPNRTPKIVKDKFLEEMCDYVESGLFHQDLTNKNMEPADRLNIIVKVANFILPKQSAVTADVKVVTEEQQSLIDTLKQLADENE